MLWSVELVMPTTFRPYDPDQALLFPPSPSDWLPEDHLAHFVSDTVEALDLSPFYEPYQGDGRRNQPFEPRMMLKVLIYSYATGTFSSRRIAKRIHEDIALRYLAAGNFPSHRTICDFRLAHLKDFEKLFIEIVRIAREVGLTKLGTIAVDGSKVKANASKHKAMSYGRMKKEEKRLRDEIRALTRRARREDLHEDGQFGRELSGEEIPEELARREIRLEKIEAARKRLEERQAEEDREKGRHEDDDGKPPGHRGKPFKRPFGTPPDEKQDNFTDPDSRIMKQKKSYEQCYNAQIAVEEGNRLIVANGVSNVAADTPQLQPILKKVTENVGTPKRLLADAGYRSEANLLHLQEAGVDGYVAIGRERSESPKKIPKDQPATCRMQRKLETKAGAKRYARRKHLAEPPFGWIKSVIGFVQFSFRGGEKVGGEWDLVCLATNLRRLNGLMGWV